MPPGVDTVTVTGRVPGGAMAVICVLLTTLKDADVVPNRTDVAPVRAVPVMVTGFPPVVGPWSELRALITGVMEGPFVCADCGAPRPEPGHGDRHGPVEVKYRRTIGSAGSRGQVTVSVADPASTFVPPGVVTAIQ
ncbi:hypothetical protein Shyhy01_00450 [Streptomyces hygroscopicus subsp. hygroscopicus]|nr:hypothetical protein Shyhy01_00450 [Streptomyces hygroscopicus subsp. hygroscopicus]